MCTGTVATVRTWGVHCVKGVISRYREPSTTAHHWRPSPECISGDDDVDGGGGGGSGGHGKWRDGGRRRYTETISGAEKKSDTIGSERTETIRNRAPEYNGSKRGVLQEQEREVYIISLHIYIYDILCGEK